MMNGDLVRDKTKDDLFNAGDRIGWLRPDDRAAVEVAYLAVLTRRPTPEESRPLRRPSSPARRATSPDATDGGPLLDAAQLDGVLMEPLRPLMTSRIGPDPARPPRVPQGGGLAG